MTTTPIENFNQKECCKIDALSVNAYTDIYLDPENPTGLILDTSWGKVNLDIKSIVKAGETVTHLYLAPEDNPEGICYEREDGQTDYIPGDELSRIITLKLLKDVDQNDTASTGDVLMYDENSGLWKYYDLQSFIDATNHSISVINATLTQYGNRILSLENKVSAIENAIYNWTNDKTTKIARGNINVYGDIGNTGNHDSGIYTHDKNSNITNDLYFS